MHVTGDDFDPVLPAGTRRELGGIGDPPSVGVDVGPLAAGAVVPEVIDVRVVVPGGGQAAAGHRGGLRLDIGGRRVVPDKAPAAPAHRGRGTYAVSFRDRGRRGCYGQAADGSRHQGESGRRCGQPPPGTVPICGPWMRRGNPLRPARRHWRSPVSLALGRTGSTWADRS